MNPEVFYLKVRGEQRGPYTVPQIDHLLNSGLIDEESLFWREGLEEWQPITNLVARRKKKRHWIKPAVLAGLALIVALLCQFFGPAVSERWQELSQRDFTAPAAYWRARDAVRTQAVPEGNLIEFAPFGAAHVDLQPPDAAAVVVNALVMDSHGRAHDSSWEVALTYNSGLKEWSSASVHELSRKPQ